MGLVESVDRYDPARGAQFRTFAAHRMHGAILDGLERLSEKQQQIAARQRARRERIDSLAAAAAQGGGSALEAGSTHADRLFACLAEVGVGLALGCLLEGTGMLDDPARPASVDSACEPLELKHLQREVRALLPCLPEPQRSVVRGHYLEERRFDDIAAVLGVTKGRVSQIHRQALAALRGHLRARGTRDGIG
jgi:RNA polymerase sigma factor for flagellar operon FliA